MRKVNYKGFGIRLQYLIQEKGISIRELGRRINVPAETISNWIYAKQYITKCYYITALAKEFDVKAEWLLFGRIGGTKDEISNDNKICTTHSRGEG